MCVSLISNPAVAHATHEQTKIVEQYTEKNKEWLVADGWKLARGTISEARRNLTRLQHNLTPDYYLEGELVHFLDLVWPKYEYDHVGTTKPTVDCWPSGSNKTSTRAHPSSCSNPGYPSPTVAVAEPHRSVKNNEKLPWTVTRSCASFVGTTKPTVGCWLSGSSRPNFY